MGRLAALLLLVLTAGCTAGASATPTPLPSPTPHTPVTAAVLQASDVPTGLAACAANGPFASYLTNLASRNAALAQRLTTDWAHLKNSGATDAAISVFGGPIACAAELGTAGSGQSAGSIVIAFGDEGEADRAWQAGVFGLTPPAPGEAPPGIVRGTATGLGPSSWTYNLGVVQLAVWRKSVFVAVVAFANLGSPPFKVATAAVDARLN